MNRRDVRTAFYENSTNASDKIRQLALGALGIIWVMRPDPRSVFPSTLVWAGSLAAIALATDLLQSLYATAAWGIFNRRKELAEHGRKKLHEQTVRDRDAQRRSNLTARFQSEQGVVPAQSLAELDEQLLKDLAALPAEPDFRAPRWINWPSLALFVTKGAALAVSYVILLTYLSGKLW